MHSLAWGGSRGERATCLPPLTLCQRRLPLRHPPLQPVLAEGLVVWVPVAQVGDAVLVHIAIHARGGGHRGRRRRRRAHALQPLLLRPPPQPAAAAMPCWGAGRVQRAPAKAEHGAGHQAQQEDIRVAAHKGATDGRLAWRSAHR